MLSALASVILVSRQLNPHELDELTYSVDIMGKPEAVEKLMDLDAKNTVLLQSGHKRGLLLPDLKELIPLSSR